jgi:inner membrane protein
LFASRGDYVCKPLHLEIYNQKASTHHVYADVDGILALDSSIADGKYFIIAAEGEEFIVKNSKGIYKTGKQLIANKLTASVGEEAKTTIETLNFDDSDARATLKQLQANHKNAAIFLSGTLTVDFPEDLRIANDPTQYPVIERTDNSVRLTWCPIESAIATLKEQFAIGTLTAKIISPPPEEN